MNHPLPKFDAAILVTEENLDKIAKVNGGLRPEVETPNAIYIVHGDHVIVNTILSQTDFFSHYKRRTIPKHDWFRADPKSD